jgi:type VI protein secretion system component VasF
MSAEYEKQLEQQNEQLQQKLAGMEQSFNRQLMEQTHKASDEAYTHYAKLHRWLFAGMSLLVAAELFFIVVLIEQNDSLGKQRDTAPQQPIVR